MKDWSSISDGTNVVKICAAEARSSDLDKHLVAGELIGLGGGALLGSTGLGSLVDGEGRHCLKTRLVS